MPTPVVHLRWPGGPLRGTFRVPASKSESNRALILRALAGGGAIGNLSDANDTQLLDHLLELPADTPEYDCEDAGTTLRFFTAYAAATGRHCLIRGTARMHERPIGPLVDALRALGADILYEGEEGFPPLRLRGFVYSGVAEVTVRADLSSQFISALLLIAPILPQGLTVRFAGAITSAPYLRLTLLKLAQWGANQMELRATYVRVPPAQLRPTAVRIEADWSSAAFAYALLTAGGPHPDAELWLPGLLPNSEQGDRRIAEWQALLGLRTEPAAAGVWLRWGEPLPTAPPLDFTDCPDLAPAMIVALASLPAAADFKGLQSLRLKESDRLLALQTELARFGTELFEVDEGEASLVARPEPPLVNNQFVETYHDHRIAMAFAALAMRGPISIRDPGVVRKSFPDFWNVLIELGFEVEFENA